MNKLFTHSLLTLAIAASAPAILHAEETKITDYSVVQYGTHMVTGLVSQGVALATPIIGVVPGIIALLYKTKNIPVELTENIHTTYSTYSSKGMYEEMQSQSIDLSNPEALKYLYPSIATLVIGCMVGTALGVYTMYKTPQWTDTYLLGKKTTRSTKQNIITFMSRMGSLIAPYLWAPLLGISLGEFLSNRMSPAQEEHAS